MLNTTLRFTTRLCLAAAALLLAVSIATAEPPDIRRWAGYPAPRKGVVLVQLNASGVPIKVSMYKSTGDRHLDASAIFAFKGARFKPGTVPLIRIPITFTKDGATF